MHSGNNLFSGTAGTCCHKTVITAISFRSIEVYHCSFVLKQHTTLKFLHVCTDLRYKVLHIFVCDLVHSGLHLWLLEPESGPLMYVMVSAVCCYLWLLLAWSCPSCVLFICLVSGRSALVVTRLPAAREDPGSRRAAGKSLCFHKNHCDTQLWARAAHWLQCLGRLSLPPSEGR